MPGGKGTLVGGDGYMFNKKATPEQIKAGLKWLDYKFLTPGKGSSCDYARAKPRTTHRSACPSRACSPAPPTPRTRQLKKANANVPVENYQAFLDGNQQLEHEAGAASTAQQIYAVLDGAVSAVLTKKDADIDQLLKDAEPRSTASWPGADADEDHVPARSARGDAARRHGAVPRGRPPGGPRAAARSAGRSPTRPRAYAFLIGGLLCFALFSWYPMIRAVVIAFQKYTPGSDPQWVGTANFTRVFHDPEFRRPGATRSPSPCSPCSSASRCRSSWPSSSTNSATPRRTSGSWSTCR